MKVALSSFTQFSILFTFTLWFNFHVLHNTGINANRDYGLVRWLYHWKWRKWRTLCIGFDFDFMAYSLFYWLRSRCRWFVKFYFSKNIFFNKIFYSNLQSMSGITCDFKNFKAIAKHCCRFELFFWKLFIDYFHEFYFDWKGVTFLAFGNGAPDIFSSLAGIKKERAELVIGELFGIKLNLQKDLFWNCYFPGAGIFVTSVVAGYILLSNDFKLMERPLLRDVVFYMLATFLTWFIFISGQIKIEHAIGMSFKPFQSN